MERLKEIGRLLDEQEANQFAREQIRLSLGAANEGAAEMANGGVSRPPVEVRKNSFTKTRE